MINRLGRRFVDEGMDQQFFTYARYGGIILGQPGALAYQIFDQKAVHLLEPRYATAAPVTADTLGELIRKLDLDDRATARETLAAYNEAACDAAVFMRGGTSNGIVFHARDLPPDRASWNPIFLAALGSPNPYGRQLDGIGGGISSLSKVCVIGPPSVDGADVDYTFAQVSVGDERVDYAGNCGNMSSAMGPFAVDEGLVRADGPEATVRIHNTNTGTIIQSRFAVEDGRLLPTGRPVDVLAVPGAGAIEMPADLDAMAEPLERLECIRAAAGVLIGIARTPEEVTAASPAIPRIGFVAPPRDARTLSGETVPGERLDLAARMISIGRPHRALPLTGALAIAVAARLSGTVVNEAARVPAAAR